MAAPVSQGRLHSCGLASSGSVHFLNRTLHWQRTMMNTQQLCLGRIQFQPILSHLDPDSFQIPEQDLNNFFIQAHNGHINLGIINILVVGYLEPTDNFCTLYLIVKILKYSWQKNTIISQNNGRESIMAGEGSRKICASKGHFK